MQTLVRPVAASDKSFLFSTFLRGLYHGNSFYKEIDQDIFYSNYTNVLERLLQVSKAVVVCLAEDTDVVLAYAILSRDGTCLHYCFTKQAWRHKGLQKLLVPKSIREVSHITHLGNEIRKQKDWLFNPFRL